ncbi:RlmI/RlmK family 23S rRNA methyltransferase, partial [Acinetobacter baumannii]
RLAHAEGDGLPGFVIDRYGDVAVVQANTAGAETLTPDLLGALETVIAPRAIVLRNDAAVRGLEGLASEVRLARGTLPDRIAAEEGGLKFP